MRKPAKETAQRTFSPNFDSRAAATYRPTALLAERQAAIAANDIPGYAKRPNDLRA